jgi:hypothetical protein
MMSVEQDIGTLFCIDQQNVPGAPVQVDGGASVIRGSARQAVNAPARSLRTSTRRPSKMKTSAIGVTRGVEKLNDLTGDVKIKPGNSNVSVKTSGNNILVSAKSGSTQGVTSLKGPKGDVITLAPGSNVTIQTEAAEPVPEASGSVGRQPAASADEQSWPTVPVRVGERLDAVERKLLIGTLEAMKGDRKRAAELLGISLKTIYNRLKKYGLDPHKLPEGRARGS